MRSRGKSAGSGRRVGRRRSKLLILTFARSAASCAAASASDASSSSSESLSSSCSSTAPRSEDCPYCSCLSLAITYFSFSISSARDFASLSAAVARASEASCWAHARRKFFDLARINKAPIAIEAVERIDALFAIEREINGAPPHERKRVRNERSWPLIAALEIWLREQRRKLSARNEIAKAI